MVFKTKHVVIVALLGILVGGGIGVLVSGGSSTYDCADDYKALEDEYHTLVGAGFDAGVSGDDDRIKQVADARDAMADKFNEVAKSCR